MNWNMKTALKLLKKAKILLGAEFLIKNKWWIKQAEKLISEIDSLIEWVEFEENREKIAGKK